MPPKDKKIGGALVFKTDAGLVYTRPQLEFDICGALVRKTCKSLAG